MTTGRPRIAVPLPTSADLAYNERAWPQFAHAIEEAGGEAVEICVTDPQERVATVASTCVGVVLPGSPADLDPEKYGEEPIPLCRAKDPAREAADELLLQDAFNLHKPVLAVCYGMQALNVWKNGRLVQDLPTQWKADGELVNHGHREAKDAHQVVVTPGSRLATILAKADDFDREGGEMRLSVNSSHHQAVRSAGDQLMVAAKSPSDGVIEAITGTDPAQFLVGVQWHPERAYDSSSASRAIFAAFLDAARAWRKQPIGESVGE